MTKMTPAEFEWAQEQIELAYLRSEIGKLTYLRRMSPTTAPFPNFRPRSRWATHSASTMIGCSAT